jgi:hypothetical protein
MTGTNLPGGAFLVDADERVAALQERAGQLEVGLWNGLESWLLHLPNGEVHGLVDRDELLEMAFVRAEHVDSFTVDPEDADLEADADPDAEPEVIERTVLLIDWLPMRVSELAPAGRILVLAMPVLVGEEKALPFIIKEGHLDDVWLRRVQR